SIRSTGRLIARLTSDSPKPCWNSLPTRNTARGSCDNVLTNSLDPEVFYGNWTITLEPALKRGNYPTWDITPKHARTLPTLRVMCGSEQNLDAEYGMMHALLSAVRVDGLMYNPFDGPGAPKGTSYPQLDALMILAMYNRYSLGCRPAWLKWIDRMAKGLRKVAIQVEDRAFYPMQSGIDPKGNWHIRNMEGNPPFNRKAWTKYRPTDEPKSDAEGYEGAARAEANRAISALVLHYQLSGDRASLDMAKKVLRFVLKPGIWAPNSDEKRYPGFEHGIWSGHFHNGTQGLSPLIDMAQATNSAWLKQFAREYHENTHRHGIVRMGWLPAWSLPERYKQHPSLSEITEPCALGDFVVNAVRLSDAGLGDFWDDVDYTVRNHLAEQQFTDLEEMRRHLRLRAGSDEDALLQKFLGAFYAGSPTRIRSNGFAGCCTVNGAQGLYYAWHGITRFDNGVATVNLFLNRASPWMDIDSHLPYEGKVVLHNKQARTALVRIPGWAEAEKIRCRAARAGAKGGPQAQAVTPARAGSYLVFEGLAKGDTVTLEFPVPIRTDRYTIAGKKYAVTFKGSTVIDIGPREDGGFLQLYRRDAYRANQAPLRKVKRFVADRLVPLRTF
ncbi:MAG TPA: hypothetical protein VKI65_12540, partial [Gemmataceae bacterium]|nr:hypothetical protein [Gemmataceae bacterium]